MKNLKVQEFIEELASNSPAPGGGSVAALGAAIGGALSSMVYNLTIGKKAYEALEDDKKIKINENLKCAKEFYSETLEYMEKDKNVFLELMKAYKMPKETDELKKVRKEAIDEKMYGATMVPFNLCKKAIMFYENIEFACEYGNKNAVSDAGVAAIMLHAGIESAILNVKINLASLNNEELKKDLTKEINECLIKSNENKERIVQKVNLAIG